jgi:hypothetical protein
MMVYLLCVFILPNDYSISSGFRFVKHDFSHYPSGYGISRAHGDRGTHKLPHTISIIFSYSPFFYASPFGKLGKYRHHACMPCDNATSYTIVLDAHWVNELKKIA